MNITFRKFTENDRNDYLSMTKKFFMSPAVLHCPSDKVFTENFEASCQDGNYVSGFIIESNEKTVGYSITTLKYETEVGGYALWIEDLYIDADYRRNGIGKKFLNYIKNEFCGKVKRLRLEVGKNNTEATKLYKQCGFDFLDYLQMNFDFEEETV